MKTIPDPSGRRVVITGATGGIGFETALALAGAGARVILTGRDAARGEAALRRVRAAHPSADVGYRMLDLSSLAAVAGFVAGFGDGALDVLVNNAGIMALAQRQTTKDGFEAQFGVNFLGHFALTAGLLPALRRGAGAAGGELVQPDASHRAD